MEETSGVRQILGEALDKIKEREAKVRAAVSRFQPELSDAEHAIKALEKVLGPARAGAAARRPAEPRRPSQRKRTECDRERAGIYGAIADQEAHLPLPPPPYPGCGLIAKPPPIRVRLDTSDV